LFVQLHSASASASASTLRKDSEAVAQQRNNGYGLWPLLEFGFLRLIIIACMQILI